MVAAVNGQPLPTVGAIVLVGAFLGTCFGLGMLCGSVTFVRLVWRR